MNKKIAYIIASFALIFSICLSLLSSLEKETNDKILEDETIKNEKILNVDNFENLYNTMDFSKYVENQEVEKDKRKSNLIEEKANNIILDENKNLYYISDNKLIVTNVEDLIIQKEIDFKKEGFKPKAIFLYDNNLIVTGTNEIETDSVKTTFTIAKIYTIDEELLLFKELKIEGEYVISEVTGSYMYLFSSKDIDYENYVDKTVEQINENDFRIMYSDTDEEFKRNNFENIYYFQDSMNKNILNIMSFNLKEKNISNVTSYINAGTDIKISNQKIYIVNSKYIYKDAKVYGYYDNYEISTYIYKLSLEKLDAEYLNVKSVEGKALTYDVEDQNNGLFSIITLSEVNDESTVNPKKTNDLYILDENLEIKSSMKNIEEGKEIYSIDIQSNRMFIETDNLTIIDIEDMSIAQIIGNVNINDNSLLYIYDDNNIIEFKKNSEDEENNLVNEVKITMLDITDIKNKSDTISFKVGEDNIYSGMLQARNVMISEHNNIMLIPIEFLETNDKRRN